MAGMPVMRMYKRNISGAARPGIAVLLFAWLLWLNALPLHAETAPLQGLLWEVSKPGTATSHLFGTIHSEDPEVLQLGAPVQAAFDAAHSVVLEVLLDTDAMQYSSAAMLLMDGRTLAGIIGADLFSRASRATRSRGIPDVLLQRMKPWAVAVTLSMPVPDTGQVLDMVLYQSALQANKPVHGLETIHEQLDVFDDLSESDQIVLLRDALDNFPELDAMHAELLAAYKQRDLGTLQAINDVSLETGDRRLADHFQRRLIGDRNRLMAERMQPYLEQGRAFVAVGALHLPGADGLLQLLQQHGYTVRVVY
jgi:uncharacterized protein YbaP (TraB family)